MENGSNNSKSLNDSKPQPILNKVKKRVLMLSPTVEAGLERECNKTDFYREGDKAVGKGGFGEVWKVTHKLTQKSYVIKVIDKKNIIEQKMVEQMNREIEIMYRVDHHHVVKLINHYEDDDKFYLVMLFASKGQVYSLLKRQSRFDQRTAAQYMREVLDAVKYLHSFDPPIIHRDIKPENLLLDENGRIKLADFGWSNFKNDEVNRTTYCGTPEYLSPEMVKKQGHDTTVDIWSLGVLLFEFLAGHAPFSGSSQEELFMNIRKLKINWPNDFPPLAKNLITKILKLNPFERLSIDEILAHSWFEKNPPFKPILINSVMDKKSRLESHLVNVMPETVTDKISELLNVKESIAKVRNSIKNAQPNEFKSIIDQLQIENEKLNKENSEIKQKYQRLDSEIKILKTETMKIKDTNNNQNLNTEIQRLTEELEKYKIINRERLDLLSEIEEKNNSLFDFKNKIKNLEGEYQNLLRNNNQNIEKCSEYLKIIDTNEIKINELKSKIKDILKEKEDISTSYQKKLEILHNKMLDNTDDSISNSNSLTKVIEMLNDSINEFIFVFKIKISSITDILSELKELQNKSEGNLNSLIKERSDCIIDILGKLKNGMEDDLSKVRSKIYKEIPTKNNEMVDWLKKQINELQPYKNKVVNIENKNLQINKQMEQLTNEISLTKMKLESYEKLNGLKENKIIELKIYCENLEAKLSDVKDFVFKNCQDKLDSFNNSFNNYFIK
jgi:serine/threonine protein kinase